MIRFPCRCGHTMEVADDLAAGDAQCPNCGLLNTVPTLNDAAVGLENDGTYTFDDDQTTVAEQNARERLRSLHRAYTRNTRSADGSEIDNRVTLDELALAGEIPLIEEKIHERPKYDPVTGELLRPLEVQKGAGSTEEEIPMARAAITYATGESKRTNLSGVIHLLTSPGNLAVLGVMYLVHLFVLGLLNFSGLIFVGVVMIFFAMLIYVGIVAHFANTVDEVGPRDMDELPRPLRDLSPTEDLFGPFIQFAFAMMLAYGPVGYVTVKVHLPMPAQMALLSAALLWGVTSFPALLLTMTTSGSITNLRPDRLLSVARAGGGSAYVGLCLVGVVALVTYVVGTAGTLVGGAALWTRPIVAFPFWCLGIFLMHLFCYQLGLFYREYHRAFSWAYQRHVKLKPGEEMALRAARRAVRMQERAERQAYRGTSRNMGPRG